MTEPNKGWRYEVLVSGKWYDNAVVFATQEEAQRAADAKMWSWTQCEDTRVVETDLVANYRFTDDGLVHIPGVAG